eukprot:1023839-Rhodomonas_salina.1
MGLRACYALSGTDLAYDGVIGLRACYALSGTGRAYACISLSTEVPCSCVRLRLSRWEYAIAYAAMPRLRDVRYWASICCYAMCGTELACAAMQCSVLNKRMLLRNVRTAIEYAATQYSVLSERMLLPVRRNAFLAPPRRGGGGGEEARERGERERERDGGRE